MAGFSAIAGPILGAVAGGVVNKVIGGGGGGGGGSSGQSPDNSYQTQLAREAAEYWGDPGEFSLPAIDYTDFSQYATPGSLEAETWTPWIGETTSASRNADDVAKQKDVLEQLMDLGHGAWLPSDQIALDQLSGTMTKNAKNSAAQAERALAATGGGGGTSAIVRMLASQEAADSGKAAGQAALKASIDRTLAALQGAGTMSNTLADAGYRENFNNAQVLNNWNDRQMQLMSQSARDAAQAKMDTARYNQTNQQRVAEANTDIRNSNITRGNANAQQDFANRLTQIQGKSNALLGVGNAYNAAEAANAQRAQADAAGLRSDIGLGASVGKTIGDTGVFKGFSNLFQSGGVDPAMTSTNQAYDNGSGYGYF